jgi:hypothetical protein
MKPQMNADERRFETVREFGTRFSARRIPAQISVLFSLIGVHRRSSAVKLSLHLLCVLCALCAIPSFADNTETWDSGSLSSWVRYDPLNQYNPSMNNPGDHLLVSFRKQSMAFPEVNLVKADTNASAGAFTGNYRLDAITNISFRIFADTLPSDNLQLVFSGGPSNNIWRFTLNAPAIGEWTTYNVPTKMQDGWSTGAGPTVKKFKTDLKDVQWIGISIQRNSSVEKHAFQIDDFTVNGIERGIDTDNDGMTDWQEFIAGTDHKSGKSRFRCKVGRSAEAKKLKGAVLEWESVEGLTYTVWRSIGDLKSFERIATGIEATYPLNIFNDLSARGKRAYFYKLEVE